MKILFFAPGNVSKVIKNRRNLLQQLSKNDHKVTLCATGYDSDVVTQLNKMGICYEQITFYNLGINPFLEIFALFCLLRLSIKQKPDIIFSYGIKLVIYASIAGALARVQKQYSMITGLGYAFSADSPGKRVFCKFIQLLLLFSLTKNTRVFFQNNDDLTYFVHSGIIKPNQSSLIDGSGVDVKSFTFSQSAKTPLIFLQISRLLKAKGILEFIRAAEIIKRYYPDIIFKIVGPFDKNHPDAISPKQFEPAVKRGIIDFLGELQDVRPALREASVFVLPSYYEGIPRTVLEAMAIGRPIITTNRPGCKETVIEGINGFLIPSKDVDSLVKAMKAFICHPELINEMGCCSRIIVEDRFDVEKVTKHLVSLMEL